MGLERVIGEILAAGEERRRKIIQEGDAEKQRILSSAKAEAESARKERIKDVERRASLTKQQSLSSAELEAKKRLLKEQNALLVQAKGEVLKSLSALDADARKDLLGKLSKIAAKQLSKGVIHCRKEDEKMIGVPPGFKKAADLKASGGILAESEEGDYRMDLTFEVLLDDIWNKDVQKVYEIMFGGA
jgi:V/A-type H+-transporting ATPase subunit E